METWAINQLSVFLGFDPETLKTQVLPYLMSFDSPISLSEHLYDLLGTDNNTMDFIQEFISRRFPEKQPTQKPSQQQQQQQKQQPSQKNDTSSFPSLPPTVKTDSTTEWPSNFSVYIKNKSTETHHGKNKKSNKSSSSSSGTLVSDRLEKKKKSNNNNDNTGMTLENALKELDINVPKDGKRKKCNCQATKHELLTIAPNCLNCGKIICVVEGVGPCSFCGSPVLSKEQQVSLIAEAKKKRSEQKQLKNEQLQQQKKKAKAAPSQSVGYASKVSGEFVSKYIYDQQLEDQNRLKAEQHKEKLLEFQRTSAQRSKVIDQATDFTLPTDQFSPWLTPQERGALIKKQQANLNKLENKTNQRRVLTIDLSTKQAKVENVIDSSSSEDEDEPIELPSIDNNNNPSSTGTFANNPLLKGLKGPSFRRNHKKEKSNLQKESKLKTRIQFENE